VSEQNDWTKIQYYFNVGSLPPPYHYNYTITINSDGAGELVYMMGYTKTENNTLTYPFKLTDAELKKLNKAVKKSDILNLEIKERPGEEIPDGGHSESLQIFGLSSNTDTAVIKSIPSYPEIKYDKILGKLYKTIQKCVPEEIWKDANDKRIQVIEKN